MVDVVDDSMTVIVELKTTPVPDPDPDCYVGETKTKICSDGSTIITHTCVDGKFSATNNVCPEDDTSDTMMYVVIGGAILLIYLYLRR